MQRLSVELIPDPEFGGYTARIPDIPAYGEGETELAAIADLKEALRGYDRLEGPRSRSAARCGRCPLT